MSLELKAIRVIIFSKVLSISRSTLTASNTSILVDGVLAGNVEIPSDARSYSSAVQIFLNDNPVDEDGVP